MASELTTMVAAYGALVSTLAVGWHIFRDLTDKGKLRLSCYVADIHHPEFGQTEGPVVAWSITNVGRRSVWIQTIGGDLHGDKHFMIHPHSTFPFELKPGAAHLEYYDGKNLKGDELRRLWVRDSLGRCFRAPRSDLRWVMRDLGKSRHS